MEWPPSDEVIRLPSTYYEGLAGRILTVVSRYNGQLVNMCSEPNYLSTLSGVSYLTVILYLCVWNWVTCVWR